MIARAARRFPRDASSERHRVTASSSRVDRRDDDDDDRPRSPPSVRAYTVFSVIRFAY